MTKSIKNGKAVYNFLDTQRRNNEVSIQGQHLWIENKDMILPINQETAKDLIKVLQEFAETGELK
jgi:hypothetical protein